jgi:hypothetical protein
MKFPTMAEKAVECWRQKNAIKTTSFNTVAEANGAFRDDAFGQIEWIFDDDSRVEIKGRGRSHQKPTMEITHV